VRENQSLPISRNRAEEPGYSSRAENEPERAAKLVTDAETNVKNGDSGMLLDFITAEASVAAAHNENPNVRELLQRRFEIAMTNGGGAAVGLYYRSDAE
jgi:hypothetical protein